MLSVCVNIHFFTLHKLIIFVLIKIAIPTKIHSRRGLSFSLTSFITTNLFEMKQWLHYEIKHGFATLVHCKEFIFLII